MGEVEYLKKLEQFLFYFLFFAIPFQARKILYYPGWYFNEWQSVSVYATDLILLILFVFWAVDKRLRKSFIHRYDYFLLGFLAVAAISVKNSSDFYVGIFLWLKLVEFVLLYFYLKTYAIRRFNFSGVLPVLILGGVFQAVVAVLQFLKQGDLGLRLLGESVLGPHMTGVASFFNAAGEKIIRAYGTAPHPNILAAYLLLSIFAIYFLWFYKKVRYEFLLWAGYALILFGFFFTFARTAIFVLGANFIIRGGLLALKFKESFFKKKILKVLWVTGLVVVVFAILYWPEAISRIKISGDEEAVRLRSFYNRESLGGGINVFGVGLGDFTGWLMEQNPNLPRHIYQPVHNIYLLIFSEMGVAGIAMFILFLIFLIKDFVLKTRLKSFHHYSVLLVFSSFLFIGLFDHFLLTVQQGRFVFWLVLTIMATGGIMEKQSRRAREDEKA